MIDFRKTIQAKMAEHRWNVPDVIRLVYKHQDIVINHQALYNFLAGKSEMTAKYLEAILNELGAELK
jgi:hypothetical protein